MNKPTQQRGFLIRAISLVAMSLRTLVWVTIAAVAWRRFAAKGMKA